MENCTARYKLANCEHKVTIYEKKKLCKIEIEVTFNSRRNDLLYFGLVEGYNLEKQQLQ